MADWKDEKPLPLVYDSSKGERPHTAQEQVNHGYQLGTEAERRAASRVAPSPRYRPGDEITLRATDVDIWMLKRQWY